MPVPLTLVLALPSVATRALCHPIAPDPAVLLCEHIWYLEDEIEVAWHDENEPNHREVRDHPEGTQNFMVTSIEFHAMRLWKGEQVDGTVLQSWAKIYREENILQGTIRADRITKFPTAVMAGYRYLTSVKSTPRCMRPQMHEDLFSRSCEFSCLNTLK